MHNLHSTQRIVTSRLLVPQEPRDPWLRAMAFQQRFNDRKQERQRHPSGRQPCGCADEKHRWAGNLCGDKLDRH
nr:hypothetical protein CFP56_11537 [Quercus suber]